MKLLFQPFKAKIGFVMKYSELKLVFLEQCLFSLAEVETMDTDKCVAPPITFVYYFGLQNLRRQMCCRAINNNYMDRFDRYCAKL